MTDVKRECFLFWWSLFSQDSLTEGRKFEFWEFSLDMCQAEFPLWKAEYLVDGNQ